MGTKKDKGDLQEKGFAAFGGIMDGLNSLLGKIGELAEKGEDFQKTGEITGPGGKVRGVYGVSVKLGLGEEGIAIEPFGNIGKDDKTGRPVVHEVSEPIVDIFEEKGYLLLVAEMPGIGQEDVHLDLKDDVLTITAEKGAKKYRKEVLLPAVVSRDKMTVTCRNGILEVRFAE